MNEEELRRHFAASIAGPPGRDGCPAPERLRGIVEGTAPEAERLAVLGHVATCRPCQDDLSLLRTLAESRALADRSVSWRGALAAAAAVLVVGTGTWAVLGRGDGQPVVRGGEPGRITTFAPADTTATPLVFTWAAQAGAARYTVRVVDGEGRTVWSGQTADTTVTAEPGLASGRDYRWWVDAALADGTTRRSVARRFHLTR